MWSTRSPASVVKYMLGNTEAPRDVSQRAQGCMHEGGYLEVCHCGASMGSAAPCRLGWDVGAGQGHQAYPAEGKGGIIHREDLH